MALIKLTAIVDNISGKLNGTVFARNKGGHYMRSKSHPTNPRSLAQIAVRAAFGAISQLWRGLTSEQRNAWNQATADHPYQNRLGDTKTLSGFALHQKLNRNLILIGQPVIQDPPTPQSLPAPVSMTAATSESEPRFTFDVVNSSVPTGATHAVISATPALSPGIRNFSNRLRVIQTVPFDPLGHYDIASDYFSVFGAFLQTQKIGVSIKYISAVSGEESTTLEEAFLILP